MNLIRQGQELIAETLKEFGSETITYRRGSMTVAIAATPAPAAMTLGLEFGGTVLSRDRREWIFTAADLVFPGQGAAAVPKAGDLIDAEDNDGMTRRYIVSADGQLPEFELADAFGIMLRVRGALKGLA